MLTCVDVHYGSVPDSGAVTACLGFADWSAEQSSAELVHHSALAIADYESGSFYKRELPLILEALVQCRHAVDLLVIDGYVWLGPSRPGLGMHLYEALKQRVPVVGVAKRPFHESPAIGVLRGDSRQPLFVTAVGIEPVLAAKHVQGMHGEHRLPTLLKRVDGLARGHVSPTPA